MVNIVERNTAQSWEELLLKARAAEARGMKLVAVQGLGFVGCAVVAVVAAAQLPNGQPRYFVIGVDVATPEAQRRIACINAGVAPIASPDPELPKLLAEGRERGNLVATSDPRAFGLAETVLIDINLDVTRMSTQAPGNIELGLESFSSAIKVVGSHMNPAALVIVETTVPIGGCEKIVQPILASELAARGSLEPPRVAHAYERVTPGVNYVRSIRSFYRTYSGMDEVSAKLAGDFLGTIVDVESYPLRQVSSTRASEMAKILENSYRAANIALIQEWTVLAEEVGVNLFEVIESIRVRKGTHDNIRQPGFGVGGYCLTKDSFLAQFSAATLFGSGVKLEMTMRAMEINYAMPLHSVARLLELLDGSLAGKAVALFGVSYIADVGDTRNSPSEQFVDKVKALGAEVRVHDPAVEGWRERPEIPFCAGMEEAARGADAVVFSVPHKAYLSLQAADLKAMVGKRGALLDANNLFGDGVALELRAAQWRVAGVGKGHWRAARFHQA